MTMSIPQQDIAFQKHYSGFILERIQTIPELQTTGYLFRHKKSGAHCIHLFNKDPNNLFSIAFRTPVSDNTGVPHILEHSVLCGSKRFPVKDPFQEMLKGSLQTFLNALTYPDKTVYPVSSQVEKDYYNLVSIYADAVFNPIISENTFFQEGWHFDVESVSSPIGIKGIVYNEMKGVFSNFASHVDRRTLSALFPDTTYHFESGGNPEYITELTYDQFISFHKRYYHPSNAYIVLYGNLPSEKTLKFLDSEFLKYFDVINVDSDIELQPLWTTPRSHSFYAPAPLEDKGSSTVVIAWIFGESTDPLDTLAGRVLSYYLLDTESSPLRRALIDSGLGEDLADFCGFDSELRQSVFAAGLRKTKPDCAKKVEALILDTLQAVVNNGPDYELIEGALRQVEFNLREVGGGHFPYNLQLADRCYRSWIYGGDPFVHLAFEQYLSVLKDHCEKRDGYFTESIGKKLLYNNHRICCSVVASPEMGAELEKQTARQVTKMSEGFTTEDLTKYAEITKTLLKQQMTPSSSEDIAKLPKLDISDLPRKNFELDTVTDTILGSSVDYHKEFTSGIVYLDVGFDISTLPDRLIPFIPLYCEYASRRGAGGFSYEQMATRVARVSGGIDASVSCKTVAGTQNELFIYLFFHTKALVARFDETCQLLSDLLIDPEDENEKLIKDILLEERNTLYNAVIGSGHRFALTHAAASLSRARAIDERLGGIFQLRFLESLVKDTDIDVIVSALRDIHRLVINRSAMKAIITSDDPFNVGTSLERFVAAIPERKPTCSENNVLEFSVSVHEPVGIEINAAVNFIGKVWKLTPVEPCTAGKLQLLSRILSAGYLWDKIRVEGGAYGGMSSVSVVHPIFSCASYRDPNLLSTIRHFTTSLEMAANTLPQSVIDQNIIGTIGHIDSPFPPHTRCFNESLFLSIGVTKEFRQEMRDAVFDATAEHIATTAASILHQPEHATVILGSAAALQEAQNKGLQCTRAPLVNSGKDSESLI